LDDRISKRNSKLIGIELNAEQMIDPDLGMAGSWRVKKVERGKLIEN